MAVAQDLDSFYIIGGLNCDDRDPITGSCLISNTIYRYEPEDDSWTLLPNKMKNERYGAMAMIVKKSIFPSCE